jgi:hypothetical protein
LGGGSSTPAWALSGQTDAGSACCQQGEEEDSAEQWWGATVSRRLEEVYHQRRVFELEHDYDESFGSERSRVCFLSSCWLFDISPYFGSLMWRREGCDQTLRPSDLAPAGEDNQEVEEETNQLLQSLPPDKQRKVAADFSDFLTTVKNGIARIANKRGSEHVVTESEVREVCSNAKKAQRTDDA